MEELVELRTYLEQGRYTDALTLVGEMDEMSRDDMLKNARCVPGKSQYGIL